MKTRLSGPAIGLVVALAMGCRPSPEVTRVTPPSIVMIVIDTLRADRLGIYGNPRGLTPFIDGLASRGFVFRRAYAQSSWTGASVASLFTSRYQSQHGIVAPGRQLPDSETTLAETLKEHGYATAGFSANLMISTNLGYGQGFDTFEAFWLVPGPTPTSAQIAVRAEALVEPALKWVDGTAVSGARRRPAFLSLQFMEPHAPYAPPPVALEKVLDGRPGPDIDRVNKMMFWARLARPDDASIRDLEAVYDAEVVAIDQALRGIFTQLAARHFLDDAVVVITADHGEGFGAHDLFGHGDSLYDELIRVPLVLLLPGKTSRTDVDDVVQLVDVGPTLLELARIPQPPTFEGRSFCGLMAGSGCPGASLRGRLQRWWRGEERVAYSELFYPKETGKPHHERAVVVGTRKVVLASDGTSTFYDLERNPAEKDGQQIAAADREKLDAVLKRTARAAPAGGSNEKKPDEELQNKLRALGYTN